MHLPPTRLSSCRMETAHTHSVNICWGELEYAPFQNVWDSDYASIFMGKHALFPSELKLTTGKEKCWGNRVRGRYFWFEWWDFTPFGKNRMSVTKGVNWEKTEKKKDQVVSMQVMFKRVLEEQWRSHWCKVKVSETSSAHDTVLQLRLCHRGHC